jgi:hypothetical protein
MGRCSWPFYFFLERTGAEEAFRKMPANPAARELSFATFFYLALLFALTITVRPPIV